MRKKILIAHAADGYIEKEKSILNRSSFQIFTVRSGSEAIELHRTEKVDLLISDIDLPDMSGDRLCSEIRRDSALKHVSIILIGSRSEDDRHRFEKSKANFYLIKPVRPVELLEKVSQLLEISERKSYRVLLKVNVSGRSSNESFFCSSHDISSSGLLIETDKVLKKGDVITCSFFLPNVERIVTDAEIIRIIDSKAGTLRYGLRYLNLDPKLKKSIEYFIESRSSA